MRKRELQPLILCNGRQLCAVFFPPLQRQLLITRCNKVLKISVGNIQYNDLLYTEEYIFYDFVLCFICKYNFATTPKWSLLSRFINQLYMSFLFSLGVLKVSKFSSFYLITYYANILMQSKNCEYASLESSAISFLLRRNVFLALHSNMLDPF